MGLTFGSLFAGIGGMDLGLERAGMTCKWQCEIDDHANRVLARHWPSVRRWRDVRTFPPVLADSTKPNGKCDGPNAQREIEVGIRSLSPWSVDLICGGFPCQDISYAGKGAGLAGERSGLWYEFARVVRVLRPRFVLVENVSALLTRGLDAVLGTLAADGYDCEWACIPAASVGAPHIRDRVFVVAHARRGMFQPDGVARVLGCEARTGEGEGNQREWHGKAACRGSSTLCDPNVPRLEGWSCFGGDARQELQAAQRANREAGGQWHRDPADEPQSGVGRVAHGVSHRVDRLRGLGNAVVPQVAEWIGRRIIEAAGDLTNG
jgi:DNA (cytosine-5)-methyltransferase 1